MFVNNTPALDAKVPELRKADQRVAPLAPEKALTHDVPVVAPKSNAMPVDSAEKTGATAQQVQESKTADIASVTTQSVERAIADVREFVQRNQRSLDFQVAEESNRVIITVIDIDSNEVIRQIPPEDFVKMAEMMREDSGGKNGGLLFSGIA